MIGQDGAGCAQISPDTQVPIHIVPHTGEHGVVSDVQFTIAIDGDDSEDKNEFARDGDRLVGSFFDGEKAAVCALEDYRKWQHQQVVDQVRVHACARLAS